MHAPGAPGPIDWQLAAASARRLARQDAETERKLPPIDAASIVDTINRVRASGIRASQRYIVQPFAGRAILFQATEEPDWNTQRPDYGWRDVLTDGVEVHTFPCRHFDLLSQPYVRDVAGRLRACLQVVQTPEAPAP